MILDIAEYIFNFLGRRKATLKVFEDRSSVHGVRKFDPSVTVIIPTRDKLELLRKCIDSLINRTNYSEFSILIVDNQSKNKSTLEYLTTLSRQGVKIVQYPFEFNYSAINNFAVKHSSSEFICFLNNDTEIIDPNWLTHLIDHATEPGVGAVGSKLLHGDGTIQHLGIAMGYKGLAGHVLSGKKPEGEFSSKIAQSCFTVSGVTFACSVVNRKSFLELGGLDEKLAVGLNDVDYCRKATQSGLKNVVCARAFAIHHASKSRLSTRTSAKGVWVATKEVLYFMKKWPGRDKFYDPFWNFSPKK